MVMWSSIPCENYQNQTVPKQVSGHKEQGLDQSAHRSLEIPRHVTARPAEVSGNPLNYSPSDSLARPLADHPTLLHVTTSLCAAAAEGSDPCY